MVGRPGQQEVACTISSTNRRQKQMNASAQPSFSLMQSGLLARECCHPQWAAGLLTSISLVKIAPLPDMPRSPSPRWFQNPSSWQLRLTTTEAASLNTSPSLHSVLPTPSASFPGHHSPVQWVMTSLHLNRDFEKAIPDSKSSTGLWIRGRQRKEALERASTTL